MTPTIALLLLSFSVQAPESAVSTTPPSTVLVKGGTTVVGSTPEEILALLKEAPSYQPMVRAFDAETPQHEEQVGDVHLMVSEVTNEQYLAFVQATGFGPPLLWADDQALIDGRQEHARREAAKIDLAKQENRAPPERERFDEARWWSANWSDRPWAMPEELALVPVVYVDHGEALAYCRWAGMRLPTELEFQRAVRGKTKNSYPWGEDWLPKERIVRAAKEKPALRAATSETVNAPTRVGSYPAGASQDGIFDLIGNVWEWTSSAYMPWKGFQENEYRVSRDTVLKEAAQWEPEQCVAVGGSYGQDHYIGRAAVRRGTPRDETALGLGFRCASTERAAVDIADAILQSDVSGSSHAPAEIGYSTAATIGMDQWLVAPSSVAGAPAGYQVIRGYRYLLFTPVAKLAESQAEPFARASLESPIHLGFLATSEPLLEPALPPGTYFLVYRAAGHAAREERVAEDFRGALSTAGVDLDRDNFLFFDPRTSAVAAAIPVLRCEFDKPGSGGHLSFAAAPPPAEGESAAAPGAEKEPRLSLEAEVESGLRARVLRIAMTFRLPPEHAASAWRK